MALTKYLAQMIRSSETMLQRMMIGGEGPFPHLPNLGIVTNNSVTNSGEEEIFYFQSTTYQINYITSL